MIWRGKVLGALIGMLFAGAVGALIGAFIGHLFDTQIERLGRREPAAAVQELYFRCVFQAMGRLAKADGRVSEAEIRAARSLMHEFRLGEREMRYAIELFEQGKDPSFPLDERLQELRRACGARGELCRMFVQIQLQAALRGDSLDGPGRALLARYCRALDVSAYELVRMEALLRMQQSMRTPSSASSQDELAASYEVLGVGRSASNAQVTQAYRRLMSQNHPDKLHAKGLPESMMKLAADKTAQIRSAYQRVRLARGMR